MCCGNNGWGGNSCWIIILIIILFCGCGSWNNGGIWNNGNNCGGCGCGNWNNNCGDNNCGC